MKNNFIKFEDDLKDSFRQEQDEGIKAFIEASLDEYDLDKDKASFITGLMRIIGIIKEIAKEKSE